MYNELDKNVKEETIILSHLPDKSNYDLFDKKKEKKDMKEILAQNNLKYYKINEEKNKELINVFQISKTTIKSNTIKYLGNGKFWAFKDNIFTIYDKNTFKKLNEIEIVINAIPKYAFELENKDLVIFIEFSLPDYKRSYYLYIYRLINNKYCLVQTIIEEMKGYRQQQSYSGCLGYDKEFELESIKKLSGNRFMSISNYGIRIYTLDNNKQYTMALMDVYEEGNKIISEINENTLLIGTIESYGDSLGGPAHDNVVIEKVELKNISEQILEYRKKQLDSNKSHDFFEQKENNKSYIDESKKIVSSLKLYFCRENIIEYSTYGSHHAINGLFCFKNKYIVSMIDNFVIIFDLTTGKQLKRFIIENIEKIYYFSFHEKINNKMIKWNSINDNLFLLNEYGNLILFELDDSKEINLNIIAYGYFPNADNLIKIEEDNIYYSERKDNIIIF